MSIAGRSREVNSIEIEATIQLIRSFFSLGHNRLDHPVRAGSRRLPPVQPGGWAAGQGPLHPRLLPPLHGHLPGLARRRHPRQPRVLHRPGRPGLAGDGRFH